MTPPSRAEGRGDPLDEYEEIAEEFYRATGYLAPGKDAPMGDGTTWEERNAAWRVWTTMRRKVKALEERVATLEAAQSKATP